MLASREGVSRPRGTLGQIVTFVQERFIQVYEAIADGREPLLERTFF